MNEIEPIHTACYLLRVKLEGITDQCSAFDLFIKTEVLAVIVVTRLHSPATSNGQHSSHQSRSMAQANISVECHNSVRRDKESTGAVSGSELHLPHHNTAFSCSEKQLGSYLIE